MAKLKLYSYWRSSCSWRVRIALAYKGIDYDLQPVNLLEGKQKEPEYLAVNPSGQVPALSVDGSVITESLAILEYLEELYPDKPLLPKDPVKKAQIRRLCLIISAGIQPLQNLKVITHVKQKFGGDEPKTAWAKHWISHGFQALEKSVSPLAGKYCVGDDVSLADLCLVPQVYNGARFGVTLEEYPTLARIHGALVELDAFKAADPSKQPDCPENN